MQLTETDSQGRPLPGLSALSVAILTWAYCGLVATLWGMCHPAGVPMLVVMGWIYGGLLLWIVAKTE